MLRKAEIEKKKREARELAMRLNINETIRHAYYWQGYAKAMDEVLRG